VEFFNLVLGVQLTPREKAALVASCASCSPSLAHRCAGRDGPDTVPDEGMDRGAARAGDRRDRSRPQRRWALVSSSATCSTNGTIDSIAVRVVAVLVWWRSRDVCRVGGRRHASLVSKLPITAKSGCARAVDNPELSRDC